MPYLSVTFRSAAEASHLDERQAGYTENGPAQTIISSRMVMWNLARHVVRNVRLRDAMRRACTNPSHDGAEVAEQVAVHGCKRATSKGEFGRAIVR
jgi:hypothetical protein